MQMVGEREEGAGERERERECVRAQAPMNEERSKKVAQQ